MPDAPYGWLFTSENCDKNLSFDPDRTIVFVLEWKPIVGLFVVVVVASVVLVIIVVA